MGHPKLDDEQISGYFRANVGILIINSRGQVLAAERAEIEGAWQLPQGAIDPGEEEAEAAVREMQEEVGFSDEDVETLLRPLGTHPGWFAYQLPKDRWSRKCGRGQTQKFFGYRYLGDDERLNEVFSRSEEFSNWKWIRFSDLIEETWEVRRPVYRAVVREFSGYLA